MEKAYGMRAHIGWSIAYKSREVMIQVYRSLVMLYLEYCMQFWMPRYRRDVEILKRVQGT